MSYFLSAQADLECLIEAETTLHNFLLQHPTHFALTLVEGILEEVNDFIGWATQLGGGSAAELDDTLAKSHPDVPISLFIGIRKSIDDTMWILNSGSVLSKDYIQNAGI
ncbi:hypothetical protein S7711_10891 [Stachybotrys chartarum IBT 7711]|uniref:Uncharacterized protein n=1 Tax=Stachybotrys chartarum (strain CBS 109288 / IBT 7711) TaxID=1280523 RepID=A0A084AP36_STACB|nr:hypothetical protein S7711_10891 [Stachybotrys chartarum IBT 7711]